MTNPYLVDDRVHVPGKGMGRVCYVRPKSTTVRFDKAFRWRGDSWRTIFTVRTDDVRPWGCGVHTDCKRNQELAHACLLSRVASRTAEWNGTGTTNGGTR